MKKYTQSIIFSINKKFKVEHTPYFEFGIIKETGLPVTKDLSPFISIKKDKSKSIVLEIREAVGEVVWNSSSKEKYYFIGGTNLNPLVDKGGIEILMKDEIRVEEWQG